MALSDPSHWQDLAKLAQDGDAKAYRDLLRDITPYIRNFLIGRLASIDWVDDVVQDVLVSVHKSLHTYDPEMAFKPWLMAIVQFRKTDYLRKHYRSRDNVTTTTDDINFLREHVTNPGAAGELKDVEAELAKLPTQQREVFELMKIHGYSAKEVSEKTGLSVSAVKVSSHRTAKKLQKALGG